MNKLFRFLRGYVRIKIKGAAPDQFLNALTENRIPFWDPIWYDAFTIEICTLTKDLTGIQHIADKTFCQLMSAERVNLVRVSGSVFYRPVLIAGVIGSILLIMFMQKYLLFYDVTGNVIVSDDEIIRTLDMLHVGIGAYGPDIKPKWIKDHVLQIIPKLQWITVTQNGSTAHVVVRERPAAPQITDRKGYANIVASRGGMIVQQSIYEGQAVRSVGDVVSEGELLVSGIIDLERVFAVVHAQAEIFAKTWHEMDIVIPKKCSGKNYLQDNFLCFWLGIGKQNIKIFGNSGISDTACDKIVNKYVLTLPGDHQLPVCLIVERFEKYETSHSALTQEQAQLTLETYAVESVVKQMKAGEILREGMGVECSGDCFRLNAVFECQEMIARTVEGKWKKEDFIND